MTIRPGCYLTLLPVLLLSACAGLPNPTLQNAAPRLEAEPAKISYLESDASQRADSRIGNDAYHMMVAELAFYQGNLDLAVEHYLMAAQSQNNPAIADRAMRIARYAGNLEAAIAAAERSLELSPDNLAAQQVIIAAYIQQGKTSEAARYLNNMIANSGLDDQTLFDNLLGLLATGENAAVALEVTYQAAQTYPEKAYAQYLHGMLSAQAGFAEEALSYLNKSLELQVIDGVHKVRAKILLKLGRSDEAIASLRQTAKVVLRFTFTQIQFN